jgi:hypothetical protein
VLTGVAFLLERDHRNSIPSLSSKENIKKQKKIRAGKKLQIR